MKAGLGPRFSISRRSVGGDALGGRLARRRLLAAAEQDQVGALGLAHAQRACERLEHLQRGAHVATLLEPRVPGGADAGELRDLLAAQARRAPAPAAGEPDVLGLEARAAVAQEVARAPRGGARPDARGAPSVTNRCARERQSRVAVGAARLRPAVLASSRSVARRGWASSVADDVLDIEAGMFSTRINRSLLPG